MKYKYKLGEMARMLNIHPQTLQRYDKKNIFKAKRTTTNRRYYTYNDYKYLLPIVVANKERQKSK